MDLTPSYKLHTKSTPTHNFEVFSVYCGLGLVTENGLGLIRGRRALDNINLEFSKCGLKWSTSESTKSQLVLTLSQLNVSLRKKIKSGSLKLKKKNKILLSDICYLTHKPSNLFSTLEDIRGGYLKVFQAIERELEDISTIPDEPHSPATAIKIPDVCPDIDKKVNTTPATMTNLLTNTSSTQTTQNSIDTIVISDALKMELLDATFLKLYKQMCTANYSDEFGELEITKTYAHGWRLFCKDVFIPWFICNGIFCSEKSTESDINEEYLEDYHLIMKENKDLISWPWLVYSDSLWAKATAESLTLGIYHLGFIGKVVNVAPPILTLVFKKIGDRRFTQIVTSEGPKPRLPYSMSSLSHTTTQVDHSKVLEEIASKNYPVMSFRKVSEDEIFTE